MTVVSAPPGLSGAQVHVRRQLGADDLRIVTERGTTVAVHRRAPDGAGRVIRDDGRVVALEPAVLGQDMPPAGGFGRGGEAAWPIHLRRQTG